MSDVVRRRAWGVLTCLAITVCLLSGCNDDPNDVGDATKWAASHDPVENRGLVWAAEGTVHLGDGSTIETGTEVRDYVVAGDGVYFMSSREGELNLATEDGVTPTGARPDPDTLWASPDGQHLVFIEHSGERDRFDTPLAVVVVVDLSSGEEVVRSSEGMGDTGPKEDLADLYEEIPPTVYGVDDDTAYVATTDHILGYDLESGESEVVGEHPDNPWDESWFQTFDSDARLKNPAGTWRIRGEFGETPLLQSSGGRTVTTKLKMGQLGVDPWDGDGPLTWRLDSWLDDTTAVGAVQVRDATRGVDLTILITCTTERGQCSAVPGTSVGVTLPTNNPALVREPL